MPATIVQEPLDIDEIAQITLLDVKDTAVGLVVIDGIKHVLVLINNKYFIARARSLEPFDRRTIQRPGKIKRASPLQGGKKINIYIDADSFKKAKMIGNGNISEGVRKAVKSFDPLTNQE